LEILRSFGRARQAEMGIADLRDHDGLPAVGVLLVFVLLVARVGLRVEQAEEQRNGCEERQGTLGWHSGLDARPAVSDAQRNIRFRVAIASNAALVSFGR